MRGECGAGYTLPPVRAKVEIRFSVHIQVLHNLQCRSRLSFKIFGRQTRQKLGQWSPA